MAWRINVRCRVLDGAYLARLDLGRRLAGLVLVELYNWAVADLEACAHLFISLLGSYRAQSVSYPCLAVRI